MKQARKKKVGRLPLRLVLQAAILAISAVILAPQLKSLRSNQEALMDISISWLCLGLAGFCLSFVCAAFVYQSISSKRLNLRRNLFVQFATAFTNRLLPSGIGGIGTNLAFLIKSGHDKPAAVSLVILNNSIGFIAFCLVLLMAGALTLTNVGFSRALSPAAQWLIAGAGVAFLLLFMAWKRLRVLMSAFILQFIAAFFGIAKRPARLGAAVLASVLIAACYVGALYCCLRAADVSLPLRHVVLVFAAGTAAITVSPTPGGLGAVEVAMIASLERLGVASAPAVAAILGYRLISFWLPIIPGYASFRYIAAKRYV